MAFLRLCLIACACACASAFMPVAPHTSVQLQQRGAAVSMKTAATKPQRVNARNREYNRQYRSEMRTRIKRVLEAVDEGDYGVAQPVLSKAFAIIDKNVKR